MNQIWPYKTIIMSLKRILTFLVLSILSININAKIELLDRVIAVVDSVIMETQLNAELKKF